MEENAYKNLREIGNGNSALVEWTSGEQGGELRPVRVMNWWQDGEYGGRRGD